MPQRWSRQSTVFALGALAAWLVSIAIFYPGFMSVDSIQQYREALSGDYSNHHPPIMAVLWGATDTLVRGPAGLLMVHQAMLWTGLFLIAEAARRRGFPHAWTVLLIGVLPPVINISAALWKDVGMAFALLLAFGLIYYAISEGNNKISLALPIVAMVLIVYATMVRANAPAATLWIAGLWFNALSPRTIFWRTMVASFVIVVGIVAIQQVIETRLLPVRQEYPSQQLYLFDLTAIHCQGGSATIPAEFRAKGAGAKSLCSTYDPAISDHLFYFAGHPLEFSTEGARVGELRRAWLQGVFSNPGPYAIHRLKHFAALVGLRHVANYDTYLAPVGFPTNPWGFATDPTPPAGLIFKLVDTLSPTGLFAGVLWLAAALAIAVKRSYDGSIASPPAMLTLSALSYAAVYGIVGIAPDYRYLYWSILATIVAVVLEALERLALRRQNADGTATVPG